MIDDFIVDEIKDAFRACKSIPEVNLTARHFARDVVALQKSRDKTHRTMAIQIMNLAKYCRVQLKGKR